MPIITPQIDTRVSQPMPNTTPAQSALMALLQGSRIAQEGRSGQEHTQLADLLKGTRQQQTIDRASALKKANPDAQVSVGDDSAGIGPNIGNKALGHEAGALDKVAGPIIKTHEGVQGKLENAAKALGQNDDIGIKSAVVGLAGTVEGPSQRILQSVVQKLGGDPSIIGSSEKFSNFIDGLQRSGKSAAFKQSLADTLANIHDVNKQAFQSKMEEFKNGAAAHAPYSAQMPGFQNQLDNYGSSLKNRMGQLDQGFSDLKTKKWDAPAPDTDNGGIMSKIAGVGKGALQALGIGGAPAAPQQQSAFDPDAFLRGK